MQIGKVDKISPEMVFERPIQTEVLEIAEVELQSKDKKRKFKQIQVTTKDGVISDWDCYPCDISEGDEIRIENPDKKAKMTITVLLHPV
jgi:hypothetical protein